MEVRLYLYRRVVPTQANTLFNIPVSHMIITTNSPNLFPGKHQTSGNGTKELEECNTVYYGGREKQLSS